MELWKKTRPGPHMDNNQIKSNQIKSNQIKSNQIKSRQGSTFSFLIENISLPGTLEAVCNLAR